MPSTKYVQYFIANVLNVFDSFDQENIKFEILKSLADLSVHYNGNASNNLLQNLNVDPKNNLKLLYNILIVSLILFIFLFK